MLTLLFSTLIFALHTAVSASDEQCYGGTRKSGAANDFPWIVLFDSDGTVHCAGSMISTSMVLTAAHCLAKSTNYDIYIGITDRRKKDEGEKRTIKKFFKHPDFVYDTTNLHDVAIILLNEPVECSPTVRLAKLTKTVPKSGTKVLSAGWGKDPSEYSEILMLVELDIISLENCREKYKPECSRLCEKRKKGLVEGKMICTYTEGKDACSGDSGAPLMIGNTQVGLVSWGEGCAKFLPGVWTDISDNLDFINKIIAHNGDDIVPDKSSSENVYPTTFLFIIIVIIIVVL